MKKQILIAVLIGFMSITINPLMAQERPDGPPGQEQSETLTTAQVKKVNKILANYDSESLTEESAKAIMLAFRNAKIPPGKGIEKAVKEAGFSFNQLKKLAPPPSRPEGRRRGN